MSDTLRELLGIDSEEFEWKQMSLCRDMDTELFYDQYEFSEQVAKTIDEVCLSCPVMKQCLQHATDNGEWGVWGGVFLTSGRPDENRNSHKTPETWKAIRERIGN